MNSKILLLMVVLLGTAFCKDVVAQQIPLYSQYIQNRMLYNPAETGVEDRSTAHFIYRRQWEDFEGGPETRLLNVNGGFPNKRLGLGGFIYADYTGEVVRRIGGKLTYAYHLPLGEDQELSLGIGAGFLNQDIDQEKINVEDPTDDIIQGELDEGTAIDANVGVRYRWQNLKLGVSVPQILESDLEIVGSREEANFELARHFVGYGSYDFKFGTDGQWGIEPLLMMRSTEEFEYQFDGVVTASYQDFAWLSAGYRWDYAVTFSGGIELHDLIKVGYSYDMSINELSDFSGGTHEVMVGVIFGSGDKKTSKEDQENFDKLNNRLDTLAQKNENLRSDLEKSQDSLVATKQELAQKTEEIDSLKKAIGQLEQNRREEGKGVKEAPRTLTVNREDLEFVIGDLKKNYYLVVSSNKVKKWAVMYHEKLKKQGYEAGVVYNKKRDWYYVFITKVQDMEGGLQELYELREQSKFKDAWIHIIK